MPNPTQPPIKAGPDPESPGPVPPENQPGHHPAQEQDQPDPNAFAAKLGLAAPDAGAQLPGSESGTAPASGGPRVTPTAWPPARRQGRRPPQVAFVAAGAGLLFVLVAVWRRKRRPS